MIKRQPLSVFFPHRWETYYFTFLPVARSALSADGSLHPSHLTAGLFLPYYEKYADIVIDEEGKNAGETVDELRNIIEGMMDQKMIQMFIDEQKRKLEERDRLLSEKDEEIRQLKARIAQLEGK